MREILKSLDKSETQASWIHNVHQFRSRERAKRPRQMFVMFIGLSSSSHPPSFPLTLCQLGDCSHTTKTRAVWGQLKTQQVLTWHKFLVISQNSEVGNPKVYNNKKDSRYYSTPIASIIKRYFTKMIESINFFSGWLPLSCGIFWFLQKETKKS